jgi:kynurenine formamidase
LRIVDLTHPISPETPVYPADPRTIIIPWARFGAHPFESEAIFLSTHTGTHVDAPSHFIKGARQLHQIEPDRLIRDAVILDLSQKKPRESIEDEDIEAAEERAGLATRENEIVLLKTNWDRHFGSGGYFSEHPGLAESAAEFIELKHVSAVGIDTPNIDHPKDASYRAHNLLLGNDILVVENLCNLSALAEPRVRFLALPLLISGVTGSPIRAVAVEV